SAAQLIIQGITQVKPDSRYESILDETQAINKGLDMAPDKSLVVILPESVTRAIKLIKLRGLAKEETLQQNPGTNVIDSQNGITPSSVVNTLL
ncbi:MAG: cyanophycin synthetase, partial [Nostoc sp.]